MPEKRTRKGLATFCPACGTDIVFKKLPRRGNYVTCRNCESLLEVVRLAPITLEWAFEEPLEDNYDYTDFKTNDKRHGNFGYEPEAVNDGWDERWDDHWGSESSE